MGKVAEEWIKKGVRRGQKRSGEGEEVEIDRIVGAGKG